MRMTDDDEVGLKEKPEDTGYIKILHQNETQHISFWWVFCKLYTNTIQSLFLNKYIYIMAQWVKQSINPV